MPRYRPERGATIAESMDDPREKLYPIPALAPLRNTNLASIIGLLEKLSD
ncbi:MAG: hypothetical protein WKF34_03410 [Pyrinomonadaceae bacterium]